MLDNQQRQKSASLVAMRKLLRRKKERARRAEKDQQEREAAQREADEAARREADEQLVKQRKKLEGTICSVLFFQVFRIPLNKEEELPPIPNSQLLCLGGIWLTVAVLWYC